MDKQLQKLAERHNCYYTRFADDITFSTYKKEIPKSMARVAHTPGNLIIILGDELEGIIKGNGFDINQKKIRLNGKGLRQEVTGLTTNNFVNVRRKYIRQVSAMLHATEKFGFEEAEKEYYSKYSKNKHLAPFKEKPSFKAILKGKLNFLKMVRGGFDSTYIKYYNKFINLCPETNLPAIKSSQEKIEDALWVLECDHGADEDLTQGTGFFLENYGLVTCAHVLIRDDNSKNPNVMAFQTTDPNKKFPISINKINEELDLAILEINTDNKNKLEIGDPENVLPKDPVSLWGFPNYSGSGPPAQILAKINYIKNINKGNVRIIIDEIIFGGNSGGPVLNVKNQVIGVAAKGTGTSENQVIPINYLDYLE